MSEEHRERILDQFTRQAAQFAQSPLVNADHLLERMTAAAQAGPEDSALDSGSGPGVVVCAFAEKVRLAVGVDLTEAMLAEARQLQARRHLRNVAWVRGDCYALPFADAQFSIVVSRFTLHHLSDPAAAVREMARVCRPGGRVVVADSAPAAEKAEAFNAMERLRDPSHAETLPLARLTDLLTDAGCQAPATETMRLEGDIDGLLARSYPPDGDRAKLRRLFEDALADDPFDMALRREGDRMTFGWPLAIVAARKSR